MRLSIVKYFVLLLFPTNSWGDRFLVSPPIAGTGCPETGDLMLGLIMDALNHCPNCGMRGEM
jgi:hypothetical protein